MASRRTRIKGIANIPPRKKPIENVESIEKTELTSLEKDDLTGKVGTILTVQNDSNDEISNNILENCVESQKIFSQEGSILPESDKNNDDCTEKSELSNSYKLESSSNSSNENVAPPPQSQSARRRFIKPSVSINVLTQRKNALKEENKDPVPGRVLESKSISESENASDDSEIAQPPSILKRKFLKHMVSTHTTIKENTDEIKPTQMKSDKVVLISEIRIPKMEPPPVRLTSNIAKFHSFSGQSDLDERNEVIINDGLVNSIETPKFEEGSSIQFSSVFLPQPMDYPPLPPSPSKMNRRIKAIPNLSFRKTSFSASESEDESRRYGRIRNNSVCSVASTVYPETPTPTPESNPKHESKEFSSPAPQKRVFFKSEQSKKMAEAKREFLKKFGNCNPDKQKLKMIDLIFYNPTTNPMTPKTTANDKSAEDQEDDPGTPEATAPKKDAEIPKESEENDSMPVPQIKIGPSGEIILDEQSLIVENSDIVIQKEKIKNSAVVNGDFDTGYGIYKRAKRSLAWTPKETLRFYKALNLIGTDFSTMTQLFPSRNRRELKLKFKREEKVNGHLIDKAIKDNCPYNFADLKREVQIEQEEAELMQKLREEELRDEEERREKGTVKRKFKEIVQVKNESDLPLKKRIIQKPKEPKDEPKTKKAKSMKHILDHLDDDEDADISDLTQSDSEDEVITFTKPTRSGRVPKSTQKSIQPSPAARFRRISSASSVDSNSTLIPGSVVLVLEEASEQEHYKVFMVTPQKKLAALDLESDVVEELVNEKKTKSIITPENNVTIPATEENNTV